MAIENQDEQIPFFAPATAPSDDPVTTKDDEDYTTLRAVKKELDYGINNLYKDFNAFDVLKTIDTSEKMSEAGKKMIIQVLGKQHAYDILVPIQQMVDSAIKAVEEARKG